MALSRSLGAFDDGTALSPGVGTTPLDVRKSLGAIFSSTGVMPGGPSPLVSGTAGWAYSVAGPAYFVTSRGVSDGYMFYSNDGTAVVGTTGVGSTVPVAPGSGLQRIDIIWTRHPTNDENGDSSSAPIFGVASGPATSIAVAPTIPVGAIELGRNLMTSAATTTASTGNTITQSAAAASLRVPLPTLATVASVTGFTVLGSLQKYTVGTIAQGSLAVLLTRVTASATITTTDAKLADLLPAGQRPSQNWSGKAVILSAAGIPVAEPFLTLRTDGSLWANLGAGSLSMTVGMTVYLSANLIMAP